MKKDREKFLCAIYILIRNDKNEVLLQRRQGTKLWPGFLALPAGHVDEGENVYEAFVREAKEELGIEVSKNDIINTFVINRKNKSLPSYFDVYFEINNYKGDVVNINTLSFELLEVNNEDFIGQSTGVITHVPNSLIFSYPLRNYNKAFKYIWNELVVMVPLNFDIEKAKGVIYRIINNNDVIKGIPDKMKRELNNVSTDYRIYYNHYTPIIYTKVVGDYVEYTVRYLVHPMKARYVNSSLWKHLLLAYQKGEIELYNKDYVTERIIQDGIIDDNNVAIGNL